MTAIEHVQQMHPSATRVKEETATHASSEEKAQQCQTIVE